MKNQIAVIVVGVLMLIGLLLLMKFGLSAIMNFIAGGPPQ